MNLENLRSNYSKLLKHLKDNGYSDAFGARVRRMIEVILAESQMRGWSGYYDVLRHYEAKSVSRDSIVKAKTVIGAIMEFDLNKKYPDRTASGLSQNRAYCKLSHDYQLLIDRYKASALSSNKKESSVKVESSNASSFLLRIQEAGINKLNDIAMLILRYLQLLSKIKWSLSNLVALLRQQLFVYRDLITWLNKPREGPPQLAGIKQLSFEFSY